MGLLNCPPGALADEHVEPENGDLLLGLDLSGNMLVQADRAGLFADYRNRGVMLYSVVFDLLPIRIPEAFPLGADQIHAQWLRTVSHFDGAICISKAVADDLAAWQAEIGFDWNNRRPYRIGWFHLGADVANSAPSQGMPNNASWALQQLRKRPSFLMVGTIEPRKAYLQTIEAFSQLWNDGVDVNLAIVGKEGWRDLPEHMRRDIPKTVDRLRTHPERNKRLFWLEGISDEYLDKIYAASTCLIAASYGEGFGLPLIEAAQHKLPIIARDISVFREVMCNQALYFDATNSEELGFAINDWLRKWRGKSTPCSGEISYRSWKTSAADLASLIVAGNWPYRQVSDETRKNALNEHLNLIHRARINLVRNFLPPAQIILDLGGANCPLYKMGYPHRFKKLYMIDLPPHARHEMYKDIMVDPNCDGGEVIIRYGDMTELDDFDNESVDFVWSGQSIEHVTLDAGEKMCRSAYRVLKKGGAFCLDTPNRLMTEIHTHDVGGGFIHPEHCIEYYPAHLMKLLERSGFEIKCTYGVCEMRNTQFRGKFCYEDFIFGKKITDHVENGCIQFFYCIKPS